MILTERPLNLCLYFKLRRFSFTRAFASYEVLQHTSYIVLYIISYHISLHIISQTHIYIYIYIMSYITSYIISYHISYHTVPYIVPHNLSYIYIYIYMVFPSISHHILDHNIYRNAHHIMYLLTTNLYRCSMLSLSDILHPVSQYTCTLRVGYHQICLK